MRDGAVPDEDLEFRADPARLRRHVEALQGERNPDTSPLALERAMAYAADELRDLGLAPHRIPFTWDGRRFENLAATLPGSEPDAPRVLVGAHVDTVRGTPGADDDASGVAGVLEVARLLEGRAPRATVELALFNLEELQRFGQYRIGSSRYVDHAVRRGVEYEGALILEMIGYRTRRSESQEVPLPIRWKDIPDTGDFLACVGDGQSRRLLRRFRRSARRAAPELEVVTLVSPLRGWLVHATRRSDNASFWSEGQPALLLTDTADLRNPHYHRRSDLADTLDYDFMASVVTAVTAAVVDLAG